jgi:hypothetical protein
MDITSNMDITSFILGLKCGKKSGGGGGGSSMEGFHMVRFYNDDRTTLLYTVYVPNGSSAMYAGDTPISDITPDYVFQGFEPVPVNITADLDCYAVYESLITTLDKATWEQISNLSADGTAQNYFAVGDTKMIHIQGTVGTLAVNGDYGVYIIGFDHNEEFEGKGIHFGTFKSAAANGIDICLVDEKYDKNPMDGTKRFHLSHWGASNYGGWGGSDMRYDILGSTDKAPYSYGTKPVMGRYGYEPSDTCTANPVEHTLMSALPADLRAVMKPMTKYTDNEGGKSDYADKVTATTDYLPLLAEFEIFGTRNRANSWEQKKQKQYKYFIDGNSKQKYKHSDSNTGALWWGRSPVVSSEVNICLTYANGTSDCMNANLCYGIAPIFKV